ncbi:MAG: hypothetical protein INQ03_24710 [Candidatus Heimdallarchaeota archaeon]|nr:hypothetical protein [Candidatus Heimdallarchaeota archaeon]
MKKVILIIFLVLTNSFPIHVIAITDYPDARFGHAMVYDNDTKQVLLFGGSTMDYSILDDTWIYDCSENTWRQLDLNIRPNARFNHKMAYDSVYKKILLFGGNVADTWVFDMTVETWTEISNAVAPSPRRSFSLYFDPIITSIVLFGGYLEDDTTSNEYWLFSFADNLWSQVLFTSSPSARYGHTMIYDTYANEAILYGGRVGGLTSETWVKIGDEWNSPVLSNLPPSRYWHDMVFDSTEHRTLIFGGDDESSLRSRNDTWVFSNGIWTEISTQHAPPARNNLAMVYDESNSRIILFGGLGEDYSVTFDDMWYFMDDDWTQDGSPAPTSIGKLITVFGLMLLSVLVVIKFVHSRRKKIKSV